MILLIRNSSGVAAPKFWESESELRRLSVGDSDGSVGRFGDKEASFSKRGTGNSAFVDVESAKKQDRPTDYSWIRELKEGIEERDVDECYKG